VTIAAAVVFAASLVAISIVDLRERRVPNRIVLPAATAVLVLHTLGDHSWEWAIAGLAAFVFMLIPSLISPGSLGMGDVKLALLLGVMLGRYVLAALLVGFVLAAVPSLVLLVRGRRGTALPLAPFLAAGGLAALPFVL
jgi:leader peptidase (prepilin peptidase)/N-methyltransferase